MSSETDSVEAAMQTAGRLAPYTDGELFAELHRRFPAMIVMGQAAEDEQGVARRTWAYAGDPKTCFVMAYHFVHRVLEGLV